MSDIAGTSGGSDIDLAAAEYVLGTLDPQERATFSGRLRSDGTVRAAVARWEQRFADLAAGIDPVTPPPPVWDAIERALRADRLKVIEGGRRGPPEPLPNYKMSRNRWRAAALATSGIAAALAAVVVAGDIGRVTQPSGGDTFVAAVNRGGDKPALIVRVDLGTRKVLVRPVAAETPAGKSLELWYIDPGQKPRSMGLVDKGPETLPIPPDAKGGAATFAISVEPPGGSTTGGPTGPVVYSGQLVKE